MPTPFDRHGDIDLAAFTRICERQIAAGVTAIIVGETAGETSTLTPSEREALVRTAVRVARGRARVIAGAGSNATDRAITFTQAAEAAGADAAISVVPYYNNPMPAGMVAHFRAIARSTGLPIILHDIPSRSVRSLPDDSVAELASSESFVGLRDSTGAIGRVSRLRSRLPSSFSLLSGDDTTLLAYLAAGGHGCVSTLSNVAPDLCIAIHACFKQGRLQAARDLHQRLTPMAALLEREHPAALKFALSLLGFIDPATRLPIAPLDAPAKTELARVIADLADEYLASADDAWPARPVRDRACSAPRADRL